MNQQRPLVLPESIASERSASSHAELDIKPTVPVPLSALPQRKKKPGPKRDSKPAPNEKLERNRQAQRTHRERKEQYTKDLELEVLRLKELYVQATRERDGAFKARDDALQERDRYRVTNQQLHEENRRMREVIQSSNSSSGTDSGYDTLSASCDATRNSSFSTTDGFPGLVAPANFQEKTFHNSMPDVRRGSIWEDAETRGFASDEAFQRNPPIKVEQPMSDQGSVQLSAQLVQELPAIALDYDALGLDFVLTLEKPCMGHIQYLHVRAHNFQHGHDGVQMSVPLEVPDDGENQHISGHALMATAPSFSTVMHNPSSQYHTRFADGINREDLLRLLNLASQLETNEVELPPVKAWTKIMRDARLRQLDADDFAQLKQNLLNKVHCYRFGAVIEDHDIEDALQQVLQWKTTPRVTQFGSTEHMPLPQSMPHSHPMS